jgi:hypothetical protein
MTTTYMSAEPALDASLNRFPVGLRMRVAYPEFDVELTLISQSQLCFQIKEWPFATIEIVSIDVVPLGHDIFVVSWREKNGAMVVNVQDYGRRVIHAYVTMADGIFMRMIGAMTITRAAVGFGLEATESHADGSLPTNPFPTEAAPTVVEVVNTI